jgi:predicted pyridoxine 5'-phosphate oxidase superfamily flavin-nucleotide-binding protein
MGNRFAEIAFTPAVQAVQTIMGSRRHYAHTPGDVTYNQELGPEEIEFVQARDSFYISSVSETGWPYVQHRGGPPGFLKVLDRNTIGFADYRGNRQYVSVGNVSKDDRVALILVDYPHRARLKVLGHARIVSADEPELLARLNVPNYRAHVERGFCITVAAFDWNCPQHITPRFTQAEVEAAIGKLKTQLADLESQLTDCMHARGAPTSKGSQAALR